MMFSSTKTTADGAACYSFPFFLSFYDSWVLRITGTYFWRCPTKSVLLPFFQSHISANHLDIGVGTGYYLEHSDFPPNADITLVDLNPDSLAAARKRLGRDAVCVLHDIYKPLQMAEKYDSISMMYLLHCLPPPLDEKMRVFGHLKHNLKEGGTIFGATVLGQGVTHNLGGRILMGFYNWMGSFGNWGDSEEGILRALREEFEFVEGRVVGVVLIFVARSPKINGD